MDDQNSQQQPHSGSDLQSILNTLSSYANAYQTEHAQQPSTASGLHSQHGPESRSAASDEGHNYQYHTQSESARLPASGPDIGVARGPDVYGLYLQQHFGSHNASSNSIARPSAQAVHAAHVTPQTKTGAEAQPPPSDARSIVEWSVGLRHITKLAAKNEQLGKSISKMIKTQKEHEKQWWSGREALRQKQKDRVVNQKRLDEVLQAVGGDISTKNAGEMDDNTELAMFDKKVHKASSDMRKSMENELVRLGVPFFGTRDSMLRDSVIEGETARAGTEHGEIVKGRSPQITRSELVKLQMRMLEHLQDLYEDSG